VALETLSPNIIPFITNLNNQIKTKKNMNEMPLEICEVFTSWEKGNMSRRK
jgi:hypothetical protein